jgi:hypothetical protein
MARVVLVGRRAVTLVSVIEQQHGQQDEDNDHERPYEVLDADVHALVGVRIVTGSVGYKHVSLLA